MNNVINTKPVSLIDCWTILNTSKPEDTWDYFYTYIAY
jgi:hypothetical protein